jgi:hypothetical protein
VVGVELGSVGVGGRGVHTYKMRKGVE